MKRLVLVLVGLLLMASMAYAGWETFGAVCSPTTATQVRDARFGRDEVVFHNSDSTYSVYLASYPATSTTGLFEIEPLGYFWPEYPESGAYFILSASGDISVSGIERW